MKSFIAVKPLSIPDVIEENIQDIDRCSTVTQATSGFLLLKNIMQSFGDKLHQELSILNFTEKSSYILFSANLFCIDLYRF